MPMVISTRLLYISLLLIYSSNALATVKDSMYQATAVDYEKSLQYARIYYREDPTTAKDVLLNALSLTPKPTLELYDLLLLAVHNTGNKDTLTKYVNLVEQVSPTYEEEQSKYLAYRIETEILWKDRNEVYQLTQKTRRLFASTKDGYIASRMNYFMCRSAARALELDTAIKYRTLFLAQATPSDVYHKVSIHRDVAYVANEKNDNKLALNALKKALVHVDRYNLNGTKAYIYAILARLMIKTEDYAKSLEYDKISIALMPNPQSVQDNHFLSNTYFTMGITCMELDSQDMALTYLDSALKYDITGTFTRHVQISKSSIYLLQEKWQTAKYLIKDNISFFKSIQDSISLGTEILQLANVENKLGNVNSSITHAQTGVAILLHYPRLEKWVIKGYDLLITGYEEMGNYKKAVEVLKLRSELTEKMSANSFKLSIAQFEDSLQLKETKLDLELSKKDLLTAQAQVDYQRLTIILSIVTALFAIFLLIFFGAKKLRANTLKNYKLVKKLEYESRRFAQLEMEQEADLKSEIAEDMHDTVLGSLVGAKLSAESLHMEVGEDDRPELVKLAEQNYKTVAMAYDETRSFLETLRAAKDESFSASDHPDFVVELKEYAEQLLSAGNLKSRILVESSLLKMEVPDEMQVALSKILRELLSNTLRHAKATKCMIKILWSESAFEISIYDDGKGISEQNVKSMNGMNNIRERAKKYNGKVGILSNPEKGTIVDLKFRPQV